ncbi:MAG: 50S ribosomal protein L7 [Ruminiclostridium sp.]|nr:50S ribosomal protein L7 [Ruminiclostridium sp.]
MKNSLGTIGLCRRAGKLIFGFDAVKDEVMKPASKVSGVVIADDLSDKSKKEVNFICGKYGKAVCAPGVTMDEIKGVIGKYTGILGILDDGLFRSISKQTETINNRSGDIE